MDKALSIRGKNCPKNTPVVALANWYQFAPGETAEREQVESRMLLWSRTGKGRLEINDESFDFHPGDWVFLPWRHRIMYIADRKLPFFVGGIHVIPHHDSGSPIAFHVAHHKKDSLAGHRGRRDFPLPSLHGPVHGRFANEADRLALLATYIVERFTALPPEEALMRTLAGLLIAELVASASLKSMPSRPLPGSLRRMQEYVRARPAAAMDVEELAYIGRCSPASVHRLFRKYENESPGRWISRQKAEAAARLLRGSALRVHEIAGRLGFCDPLHFSRFFKNLTGLSPRAFRQQRPLF